ncbi:MAG: FGGY-family carbohydrate kinase [Spirochaetia bacterium]|jgi:xylulokinase|nr:FGGY-family carbohydrate kinase [Spirochaetia bacterium]
MRNTGTVVVAYDIGTTGAKTCLYGIDEGGATLIANATHEYGVRFLPNGGVEQDPDDWWLAICAGTRAVLTASGLLPSDIKAIAFCCQMQGLVLVDNAGTPVRPAMSYMDQRASEQKRRSMETGPRVAGLNLRRLLPSLAIAGGVSASTKDPVWKYQWVREHEPEAFSRVYRWLDAKEYLVARATGNFAMTPDSANTTFLYDTRPERLDERGLGSWSDTLCRLFGVERCHLPDVVSPTDVAGRLLPSSAQELGLVPDTPVFGGGGDLSLVGLGSGAVEPGDVHIYMGTSGWVSAVTDRRLVDTESMIASVMGARPGLYNYISEQETSGKCMEWVRDHLVLDEVGAYLGARNAAEDPDAHYASLFELLDESIETVPPGADGVLFAPWLHGNRSPFEDPNVRGAFFNIGLGSGKRSMIRAVAEGIAMHNRWQLESIRNKAVAHGPLRFVGGGARSRSIARIMADITGEVVETVESPQNAGALGAALLCAKGLGLLDSLAEASTLVRASVRYEPDCSRKGLYDDRFGVFKQLYRRNKELFASLNSESRREAKSGNQTTAL